MEILWNLSEYVWGRGWQSHGALKTLSQTMEPRVWCFFSLLKIWPSFCFPTEMWQNWGVPAGECWEQLFLLLALRSGNPDFFLSGDQERDPDPPVGGDTKGLLSFCPIHNNFCKTHHKSIKTNINVYKTPHWEQQKLSSSSEGFVSEAGSLAARGGWLTQIHGGVCLLCTERGGRGWLSATATDCSSFADWSHVWNKYMRSRLCILHGAVEELSRNERFWLEISYTVM